jgi:hypothetical protein
MNAILEANTLEDLKTTITAFTGLELFTLEQSEQNKWSLVIDNEKVNTLEVVLKNGMYSLISCPNNLDRIEKNFTSNVLAVYENCSQSLTGIQNEIERMLAKKIANSSTGSVLRLCLVGMTAVKQIINCEIELLKSLQRKDQDN